MRDRLLLERRSLVEHPVFSGPTGDWKLRRRYLVAFLDRVEGQVVEHVVGLGISVPGNMAGTYERRFRIEEFSPIAPRISTDRLSDLLGRYADVLRVQGPLSTALGRRLVDAIRDEAPHLSDLLDDLESRVSQNVPRGGIAEIIATQRDMTGLLLTAADMDREPLRDWAGFGLRADFLEDEPPERPYEDDVIRHDWQHLPGWMRVQASWTEQRFYRGKRRLSVFYANTRPLEHLTGVDLVYYNEFHGCFVCVQYKKFQHEAQAGWVYRPSHILDSELQRMKAIDEKCKVGADVTDIRLLDTATFFKLHEPMQFEPGNTDLVPGMYLSREHFELLLEKNRGGQGGRRIGYATVPRHLTNTLFAELLGQGWIGTRGASTDLVRDQIRSSLSRDRGLVFGLAEGDQRLGNRNRLR
ncbi:hypothetical protein [Nonomuraea roseoviolacea]|uniref:Uncharacterized protein n=1 Tax=Nonomuraea roseoviolacea subsp. carminata TaxID=160689 RepID=A0ABT1K373_9ACTN|nr:hypothetical protein [Nonomuraea roseoviolacea]MCP2348132.1 hypothetical protein [Nonomuraea roseoviolacea subsp. carminata]